MIEKDVQRTAGGTLRVQRSLCSIVTGLGTLLALSGEASATRGRVKVANNTIVTDTGTLIRGARVSLDIWDETPTQSDVDTMKNSRGLNAFHIYAEYAGSNKTAGYNVAKVDKVVDMADENDLYVVLTIGCGGANGSFNQKFVTQFWDFYGPRYKDRTHVVYEVMNEPQAWSAPYNSATLTMEKNAYAQIRGLAPDTHIMMMSYSQPNNASQAASECEKLGISWDNASVAFHTYGIDGKEDSALTSFYNALKGKGIAYACTEPNLTLKVITTKLFERDGVSQTHFISVKDIVTNSSSFSSWITSNNICWPPDFGTWPSCSGSVPGSGGTRGTGGRPGTGGRSGAGGSTSSTSGTGDRGGSTSTASGRGRDAGVGGASGVGGEGGTVGLPGAGGHEGVGGAGDSDGSPSGSGGSSAAGGNLAAASAGAGGRPVGPAGGASSGGAADGNGASAGCDCNIDKGEGHGGRGTDGGIALLLGLLALAFFRRQS